MFQLLTKNVCHRDLVLELIDLHKDECQLLVEELPGVVVVMDFWVVNF